MFRFSRRWGAAGLVALTLVGLSGCEIVVEPIDPPDPPPPTTITVRLTNRTSKPLDPQLYVVAASAGIDGLFAPGNKRTNFGFGGLGVLEPGGSATLKFNCGELGIIGTQGGIYGDDLNNPIDQGQQTILQENVTLQCGAILEFRYDSSLGQLITAYTVIPTGG